MRAKAFWLNEIKPELFGSVASGAGEREARILLAMFSKLDEQLREYEAFMARGGTLRWVFEVGSPGQAELISAMEPIVKRKGEIRITEKLPMKLMIFDQREVLIMQEDPISLPEDLSMMRVRHNAVSRVFRAFFMFFFNQSLDYAAWKKQEMDLKRMIPRPARGKKDSCEETF